MSGVMNDPWSTSWQQKAVTRHPAFVAAVSAKQMMGGAYEPSGTGVYGGIKPSAHYRIPHMQPGYAGHIPGQRDYHIAETYGSFAQKVTLTNAQPASQRTGLLPSITGTTTGRKYQVYAGDTSNHSFTQTMPGDSTFNMRLLQPNLFKKSIGYNARGIPNDPLSASGRQLQLEPSQYRQWPGKSGQLVSYQHELGRSSA